MKVIIAKIVVVSFIVVCLPGLISSTKLLELALLITVVLAIFLTMCWAINTIADDRDQKRKGK